MTIGAILVLNAGSATLKFALYRTTGNAPPDCLTRGQVDLAPGSHDDAVRSALATIERDVDGREIAAVGHRVVHGGADYVDSVAVDARVLSNLAALRSLAPLHQAQGLAVIEAVRLQRPSVPQFASFDTAFHSTLPLLEKRFALPQVWFDRGVRRYGFHGLSYEYVSSRLRELCATNAAQMARVVVAHLGSGASLCALKAGRSMDSTMGFSVLDGVPMGTRPGKIDSGILLYLLRQRGMTAAALESMLYRQSGLLGLSGISSDTRRLLASRQPRARLALEYFIYQVAREIAALASSLQGLDGLVFTGGIGEHSAEIRAGIMRACTWLGVKLDDRANRSNGPRISTAQSQVSAWVIPTNEELVIARHAWKLYSGKRQKN
jgi:acetate kinase